MPVVLTASRKRRQDLSPLSSPPELRSRLTCPTTAPGATSPTGFIALQNGTFLHRTAVGRRPRACSYILGLWLASLSPLRQAHGVFGRSPSAHSDRSAHCRGLLHNRNWH